MRERRERKWTDVEVRNMKPGDVRRETPAPNKPGLYLLLQPTGARSWCVRYRFNGTQAKLNLGSFPKVSLAMAYDLTDKAMGELAHDRDPRAAKHGYANNEASLAAHVDTYRKRHVLTLRKGTQNYIDRELDRMLAAWPGRDLRAIRKEDVVKLLDAAADRGASAENTTWQVCKAFFRFCETRLTDFRSPAATIRRPHKQTERDRVLTAAELAAVWNASTPATGAAGRLCRMLMLTGARRDEMAGLLRTEIHADAIKLPATRTKTGAAHEIALTPLMRRVLATTKGNGKFALTGTDFPVSKSGRTKDAIETPDLDWHFHDLRRTFATGLQRIGVALPVIEKALNHKMQGVMKIYNRHDYLDERREALLKWSAHIEKLVTPPMRKAA
jgi:integrase